MSILEVIKYGVAMLAMLSSLIQLPTPSPCQVQYEHLGIPLTEHYPEGILARTIWDIEIYDQKLFIGSGDYDKNKGPVVMPYYDLTDERWIDAGTLPDEQIEQFHIIDGVLMAPGCDPKQDWEWGNIYVYADGQWETQRNIPGGIHQFDMIQYEDQLFVGLGVALGQYPIAVSTDSGQTFSPVPMYKDNKPLDTAAPTGIKVTSAVVRCYDFFLLNGTLYAFYYQNINSEFSMEIYAYRDGAFHYHSDMPRELSYKRISFEIFRNKAEYGDCMYFTTGKLYQTHDMTTAVDITPETGCVVTDLNVFDDLLYVSTVTKTEDEQYKTTLWVKSFDDFIPLFYFTFPTPAQCFTYDSNVFYFGMGDGTLSAENEHNGAVLSVSCP